MSEVQLVTGIASYTGEKEYRAHFAPILLGRQCDCCDARGRDGVPDERDIAGVIARGYYRHTETLVRVYDEQGDLLGTADLRPGDDAEVAAKKLLREKHSAGGFYGPISYPRRSVH